MLIRMTVTEELADAGYRCLEAANGADALALLAANPDVSLLITDLGLPGGMNGRQVADAARASRPDLPVLFITGYSDQGGLSDGELQRTGMMAKPFRMAEMLNKVAELLAG